MNDHEKERIAAAFHQLRPDWPTKSLRTMLDNPQLTDRARRDVTVALAWVACESATATPARVLESGPWWKAAAVEGTLTRRHPHREDACHTCGREYAPTCCDQPTRRPQPTTDPSTRAAEARAMLHTKETP